MARADDREVKIVRILVAIALVWAVIALADWRAVVSVLRSVNLLWVAVALVLAVADRLIINVRYEVLLAARNVAVGFLKLLRIQLAANFLGSFLPSSVGVDAVRIAALCRSGQPTAPVVAATLLDRTTLAFATLLFGSVTLLTLAGTRIPGRVSSFVLGATAVAMVVVAVGLHPAVRRRGRAWLIPRIPQRFRQTAASIADAAMAYRHNGKALVWTGCITLGLFLVRIAFAKALAYACGIDVPYIDLLLVIPILWIIVMLPITIGGIGVQDAGYVLLMSIVGVGAPVAFSMSILEHLIARLASLPGALFLGEVSKRRVTFP
jgi:glycosyltransferase 2 family protein